MRLHVFCLAFAVLTHAATANAQEHQRAVYDVVSVHRSDPSAYEGGISPFPDGVGYKAEHVTVRDMLAVMYRLPSRQIIGGPDWIGRERFDVVARTDHPYSIDELHAMFVDVLRDRFHLVLRSAVKPGPAYILTQAPSGSRMNVVDAGTDRHSPISSSDENHYTGDRVPMNYFCFWLGQNLQEDQRQVVDHTGLTETYSFTLAFRPQLAPSDSEDDSDEGLPSIFKAVREQLGLILTAGKAPIENVVIEHAEQPSAN